MTWCENPLDLFRLATLVMSDPIPGGKVDAAYLFGHTPDNEVSILEAGLALYKSDASDKLGLCGGGLYIPPGAPPDTNAYSGCAVWSGWLVERGVKREDIYVVPRPPLSHTGTEARRLIHFAKVCEWRTLLVVTHPMHTLRAFVNTVSEAVRSYPELLIYARPGTPSPWNEEVVSSQGNVFGSRLETGMENEWARLNKVWGNSYDPVSLEEIMKYVRWREAQTA